MNAPVSTPCIGVCAVSGATGLCVGCGRTLKEIAAWGTLTEPERLRIMAELGERLERTKQPKDIDQG
jgi:predicted Fe-S protein YdhL (DUF1289 family)